MQFVWLALALIALAFLVSLVNTLDALVCFLKESHEELRSRHLSQFK